MASPNEISVPTELVEASATTSLAGNWRSERTVSITRPTLPVAPTTATLYDIDRSLGQTAHAPGGTSGGAQHILHADLAGKRRGAEGRPSPKSGNLTSR